MRLLFREPRWLAGLAVAVVFAIICVLLAQWQLDRRLARAERNATILQNYDAQPAELSAVLEGGVVADEEWSPVLLRGRYSPGDTLLVRNRPQGGANGYLVAVPFELLPGQGTDSVWLVRGWLPAGSSAAAPDTVPAPPAGEVAVRARLRPAEPDLGKTAPPGQTYRLDPAQLDTAGVELTTAFAVVAAEDPPTAPAPVPIARPDTDPGPHLAYGVQWYLFALAGLGIWAVLFRRHVIDAEPDDTPQEGAPPGRRATWTYEPGAAPRR